jgi:ABC-type branched-subunit amino acid transport system ATPase component/predicted MFS family arabinose efflux permease
LSDSPPDRAQLNADPGSERVASLVKALTAKGTEHQKADTTDGIVPTERLPGTKETMTSLRQGLKKTGSVTLIILLLIGALESLQGSGLAVLAPNIQKSLHVSSGVIVFVTGISGGFLVLGILPLGWLADRRRRGPVIGVATLIAGAMVFATGLASNIFLFFLTRFGLGISQASTQTVHPSLLADTYPISMRGRVYATLGLGTGIAGAVSPVLVGGIAEAAGGPNGWRWSFYILAIPVVLVAILAFRLSEPTRGQHEKLDVLGEAIDDPLPIPPSLEAAFERITRIRTIKTCLIAFSALGFTLFTAPVLSNLFLSEHFHLTAVKRGLVGTVGSIGVLAVLPVVGRFYDRQYHKDPSRALALVGKLILPTVVLTPLQFFMPNYVLFAVVGIPGAVLSAAAFSMVAPVLQAVAPYRLRGLVGATGAIYLFFTGATGGSVLAALFDQSFGPRTALLMITIPATLVGSLLIMRGAHSIRDDLSLSVVELHEELEEHKRRQLDPELVPALQLSAIDFSYGHVQVLFGVSFEVKRGEVLALLGTNGSGKSTALSIAAGFETPARGVVRLNGQTVTYTTAEQRSRLGIHILPGGKGVFSDMTVAENLEMGGFAYRSDRADLHNRIDRVFELFPILAERKALRADALSGGQQQMLALAIALLHDPEVLMIDELSLGLAPIVVHELIQVVEQLKAQGVTLIIVEQSLNVAAAIADRAVFLEKGHVRFEGPIKDLVERQDLVRAVFLGGEIRE